MVKKKELVLFILLFILAVSFVYVYNYIDKTKEKIFQRIQDNNIEQISSLLNNIETDILLSYNIACDNDLKYLFEDQIIREEYEHTISLMLNSNIKYAYILYRDKQKKFRFLLDASEVDKANFYQKFDVHDKKYNDAYETKEAQVIKHQDMENLYLTYLYPIKSKNKVLAIFSVDITTNIQKIILDSIKPLETFFMVLIILIFLLLLMSVIQIFHYFVTRKKIFTDPLTRLFNRNYLEEIIPMTNIDHYSLALLDLDKFKHINDTYGHKAGDYILENISKAFKECVRDADILIRYGGEEFLLLINNRNEKISSEVICERIRHEISTKIFLYDKNELTMTVSIGLHKKPSLEKNINEAIKIADKMLYIAKKEGRNKVVCYDEEAHSCLLSGNKGLEFVRLAILQKRVTCYYQPIYNHKTDEIFKYEALVRIVDKDGHIILPVEFLAQLKHTNLHYRLTQIILSIVFNKFKNNTQSVSININFSDLINPDIEKSIINTLKDNSDLASRVTFEILESDEICDIELFKTKISLLNELNVKVSIDDFGSGFANFRRTIDMEANFLKIDGSLIKNINNNEKDFKVVKSIIHFAREANMKIIAEFVHSKAVYDKLLELDVDYMQGYYISEPKASLIKKDDLFK